MTEAFDEFDTKRVRRKRKRRTRFIQVRKAVRSVREENSADLSDSIVEVLLFLPEQYGILNKFLFLVHFFDASVLFVLVCRSAGNL